MNAGQLVKQIRDNRELLVRNNEHAYEHFKMLKSSYPHLINEEVELNLELSEALFAFQAKSDYRRAIDISLAVIDKYPRSGHIRLLAMHMCNIGQSYAYLGEFDLAERYLLEALDSLDATEPGYASNRALILINLAMTYEFKATNYERAIDCLNQALELLTGPENEVKRANCLMGLGNIYNTLNNVTEALHKYRQAAEKFERGYVLPNMASAYSNIGNCYFKMSDYAEAENYHKKSLELRLKLDTPYPLGVSYFNLGMVYKTQNNLKQAEDFLTRAFTIISALGDKPFIAQIDKEIDDLEARKRNLLAA